MFEFPWAYQKIEPTTWAYVSSLLMLALFFKFSRVWSIRNLDLILIILLAPGLLLYDHGVTMEREAVAELTRLGNPVNLSLTSGGMLESPAENVVSPDQKRNSDSLEAGALETSLAEAVPGESSAWQVESRQPGGVTQRSNTVEPRVSGNGTVATVDPAGVNPQSNENVSDNLTNSQANPSQAGVAAGNQGVEDVQSPKTVEYWLAKRALSLVLLRISFLFLLIVAAVFVLRLLLDQLLVRRPMLDNNLSVGGLTFLVCSFLTFLVANIFVSSSMQTDVYGAQSAAEILGDGLDKPASIHQEMGPAYPLLHLLPVIPTMIREPGLGATIGSAEASQQRSDALIWVSKLMAILSQFAIVGGLIALGRFHFNSVQTGVGMATLYLMLPYTAQMTGRVDHVLPAALLTWAVVLYRCPFWAGIFFGMTLGLVYYPIFLLALWLSFYWEKGAARFIYGVGLIVILLVLSLFLFSTEERGFLQNLQGMFGVWLPRVRGLKGIWEFGWDPWFRLPFLVAYVSLSASFVAWPVKKTYGTLLAYSAAMMVAVQFWHGYGGGLFMAWFLPLTIATFFRPNLQDRIAKYDVY